MKSVKPRHKVSRSLSFFSLELELELGSLRWDTGTAGIVVLTKVGKILKR